MGYLGTNRDTDFCVYVNGLEFIVVIEGHATLRSIERCVCLDVFKNDFKEIVAGIIDVRKKKGKEYLKNGEAIAVFIPEYKVSAAVLIYNFEFIIKTVVLNGINGGIMNVGENQKIFELGEDGVVREKNRGDYKR